jgi:D-lactate dehydrogenase (cytochrome)
VPGFSIRARAPLGPGRSPKSVRDPDLLAAHLEDAAHYPGGHAVELVTPTSEAELADTLRTATSVLPIGAQSSLTGGATPMGDTIVSTARLNQIDSPEASSVRVGAGVPLSVLDATLGEAGRYYPPLPTFMGAFVGGTIATNAAGAATFKYGTTRSWITSITVMLASGEVLDIERGQVHAHPDGHFEIGLSTGTVRVPVPSYRMPDVAKLSAGYYAARGMDLIDLFIGSEGTLGIVTAATLRILPVRPAFCLTFVPFRDRHVALGLVGELRRTAKETWKSGDARGLDVSSIEHMDARSLQLVREDGLDRSLGITIPADATMALLVTLELAPGTRPDEAFSELGSALDTAAPDTPLVRFGRLLHKAGALADVAIAVPGDRARADQLLALREGVPASVNRRVAIAKHAVDGRIAKTAADMIVPFERIEELLAFYEAEFARRNLDGAVWGHISDGNLHPNVIPRTFADVEAGNAAMLAFGREVARLGGAPLAEHGVGRNPIKQQLLRDLYGESGIDEMRAVKRALDPEWKLSPGVVFSKER